MSFSIQIHCFHCKTIFHAANWHYRSHICHSTITLKMVYRPIIANGLICLYSSQGKLDTESPVFLGSFENSLIMSSVNVLLRKFRFKFKKISVGIYFRQEIIKVKNISCFCMICRKLLCLGRHLIKKTKWSIILAWSTVVNKRPWFVGNCS